MWATPASLAEVFSNIPTGSVWRYFDGNAQPGTNWAALAFDDTGWASGPALLGYGDPDIVTSIGFGPNANDKYPTSYFRHSFLLTNRADVSSAQLRLLRDDGAIVYLNGSEVYRNNMPDGPVSFSTFASGSGSDDESTYFSHIVSPGDLVDGTNQFAVEIHQQKPDTSDARFDFAFFTDTNPEPEIQNGPASAIGPTSVTLSATLVSAGMTETTVTVF